MRSSSLMVWTRSSDGEAIARCAWRRVKADVRHSSKGECSTAIREQRKGSAVKRDSIQREKGRHCKGIAVQRERGRQCKGIAVQRDSSTKKEERAALQRDSSAKGERAAVQRERG
jgi:hypothetical protein